MAKKGYLAVDLGASSGRLVLGLFDGSRLRLDEVYRFENGPVHINSRMYWDLLAQWSHVQHGLRAAKERASNTIVSIGVDTWGVDFGLLGPGDELIGNPYNYRDRRTAGMLEKTWPIVSREEIFAETGLQFMEFNTLYQLLAMKLERSPILDIAEHMLMMPDLFHWLLTGVKTNEATEASTSQLLNPATKTWSKKLINKLGLPEKIFGAVSPPGTKIGTLLPRLAVGSGLGEIDIVLPGSHDTASAVAAVPAESVAGGKPDWCYISSGTWSLMGVEVPSPVVNDLCAKLNFTNEGGVGGSTRLLKNIAGLWMVQECRRIWKERGHDHSWEGLARLADECTPLQSIINPDDRRVLAPADMPATIQGICKDTNQPVPDSEGEIIRCVLESLALKYRQTLGWLEELIGGKINTIHIVGGGAQNVPLCQMAADACQRRVVAGPVEATAIGNVMVQAIAAGDIRSIDEGRQIVRASFDVKEYLPRTSATRWDEAFARFESIAKNS